MGVDLAHIIPICLGILLGQTGGVYSCVQRPRVYWQWLLLVGNPH